MVEIACWPAFQTASGRKSRADTQQNYEATEEFAGFSAEC